MMLPPARTTRAFLATLLSVVLTTLSFYVFVPTASAYEVPTSAFSGGTGSMPGSALQQTWSASGQTSLGTSATVGSRGYVAGDYTPTITSGTPGATLGVSANGCPTTGTCSNRGTVTVTFSQPVLNPTIHIAGPGGSVASGSGASRGQSDFHAIFTLTTAGTSLSKRSGSNLAVTGGNTITALNDDTSANCANRDSTPGSFAARLATSPCGSVQVNTSSAVTSLTFNVSMITTTNAEVGQPANNLDTGNDELNILATLADDYGDAPSSYDAGDAARHALSNITLGASATEDNAGTANGTSSPNAGTGATGDADNGVTGTLSMLSTSTTYSQVVALSGASKAGTLAGWIDFNGNGTFQTGERATAAIASGQTSATLNWTGITGAVAGSTYARFRVGYTNAQVTSPTGAADSGEVEDYPFTVVAPPNIDLAKSFVSGTIDPVTGNGIATYTVTVANTGGPGAYGPLLDTPAFGPGLTRTGVSWTTSGAGAPSGGSATGTGPYTLAPAATAIAANTTHTFTVVVTYSGTTSSTTCSGAGSALYNSVSAAGENGGAANNSACGAPATPVRSMTLKKTGALTTDADGDGKGDVSDVITYSFLVTNTGNINITGLAISDNVVTVSCPSTNLTVGSQVTCTATYPITQGDVNAGATKVNTATATGTAAGVALTSPQDSATTSLDRRSSLSIDKSSTKVITDLDGNGPDAGDTVPFTFKVTNTGTVPLTGLTIADPEVTAYSCPTTSLAPGASTTCTATYTLTAADVAAGQAVNTATASAVPFGGTTITSAPDTETVPVPQPPTANPDTATTAQNVNVTLSPWLNDVDAPGNSALQPTSIRLVDPSTGSTTTSVTIAGQGTYTVNASGTVTFDPLPGFTGAATPVGYQIAAANAVTARSSITVTVTAVTPSAVNDTRTTAYDTTITVPVLGNDSAGAASAPLVATSVQLFNPATSTYASTLTVTGQGTYSVNTDGTIAFDPLPSFTGTATAVAYRVADANGTTAQATLTVTVRTPTSAIPDSLTTPQDITVTASPLANDTASGGATITASTLQLRDPATNTWGTTVTVAGQGTWTVNAAGTVGFDPVPSFRGVATTLDYRATDSSGASLSSTLAITVTPIDPIAISDEATTGFNTATTMLVLSNDSAGDPSAPLLTGSIVFTAAGATNGGKTLVVAGQGTFTVNAGGSVTFTPTNGFRGDTTPVTYRITDDNGQSATATIVVHVATPQPPVANPDARTTAQGVPVTVAAATNDVPGPTGGALLATSLQLFNPATSTYGNTLTISGQGVYTVNADGTVTFAPVGSFIGTATAVGYRIADEYGATATSSITVTVSPVTPTAVNDTRTTPYETPIDSSVLGNDNAGNAAIALDASTVRLFDPIAGTYGTSVTIPGQGTYTANSSGVVRFVPVTGYHGTATAVTYQVRDTNGTATTATLTITVSLPSAPVANPDTATTPQNVDVTLTPLANDTTGAASVSLSPGSVRLLDPATGTYGTSLTVAGQGTYTVNTASGTVTFDPLPGFTGPATAVGYRVTDSTGQAVSSALTVTVTALTPTAVADSRTTPYNTALSFDPLANDTAGAASAPLAPTSVVFSSAAATNAAKTLVVAGQGTWSIDPATGQASFNPLPGFTGATTAVTYRVADTNGTTATATLTVTVGTPPSAAPDSTTTQQDVTVSLNPLGNDAAGIHGNGTTGTLEATSVRLTSPAATNAGRTLVVAGQGTWSVNATTGAVTFDPLPAFTGTTTPVGYSVTDSYGNSATSTVAVAVAAITPTAVDDANSTAYRTPVSVSVLGNDAAGDASAPLVPSSVQLIHPVNGGAVSSLTVAGEGTWTINAGGVVSFAPANGFSGAATPIGYQVADDNGTLATAVVRIRVGTAPSAGPDSATTAQNVDVTLDPLGNDGPGVHGNGTAGTLDATSVVFTAAGATNGGRTLVVAGEGTWSANATTGAVTFDPLPAFTGTTTPAAYSVTDSFANTATSNLRVSVTAITPTAADDTRTTPYATAVTADVLANDTAGAASAPLAPTSVVFTSGAATNAGKTLVVAGQGTWTINAATGVVTFTPASGFSGTSTPVTYRVADANATTATATLTVTVGTAPLALPNLTSTPQDITVVLNPLSNDTAGVHGNGSTGTLEASSVVFTAGTATNGGKSLVVAGEGTWTIDPATGAVTFDPLPGYTGTTTPAAYSVRDSYGNTAASTITVTVTAITPVASDDTNATPYLFAVDTDVLANDLSGDASAPLVASSVVFTSPGATNAGKTLVVAGQGSYSIDTSGVIRFAPEAGFVGVTTPVRYRVADDNGTTASALLTITVGNAPSAEPDTTSTPQDLDVTVNALTNDAAGTGASLVVGSVRLLDPATGTYVTSVSLPGEGTYTVDTATGRVTFDPLPGFTGPSSVTYRVQDSHGNRAVSTITVTVIPITPTAADDARTTPYLTAVTADALANDAAGDATAPLVASTLVLTSPAATNGGTRLVVAGQGTYTVNPDGTVTFVPVAGFSGATTPVQYRVADDNGTTATAVLAVTVGTAPAAEPDTATTLQDVDVTLSPLGNDSAGVGGNGTPGTLTAASVVFTAGAATDGGRALVVAGQGTWRIAANGTVGFDPLPTFTGTTDPVDYRVTDSFGNHATSTLRVSVTPITPSAANDSATTAFNTTVSVPVLGNDSAGDVSAPLVPTTVRLLDPATGNPVGSVVVAGQGTWTANANGTVSFNPATGFVGSTTPVGYQVADDNGTVANATVRVTVELPAGPTARPDTRSTPQDVTITLDPLGNDTAASGAGLDPTTVVLTAADATDAGKTLAVSGQGTWTVNPATGQVTFDPLPDFTGQASPAAYRVADGYGQTASSTITVTVTPITPDAVDDTATTPANTPMAVDVLDNDSAGAPSAPLVPSSVVFTSADATDAGRSLIVAGEGRYTIHPVTGVITFSPEAGFTGASTPVGYRVADDNGTTATASLTVTVGSGPVARADSTSTAQNVTVTLNPLTNDAAGVDGDGTTGTLIRSSVTFTGPAATDSGRTLVVAGQGTWTIDPVTGQVTFDPLAGFTGPTTPAPYSVSDSFGNTATSTITVTVTPITPVAANDTATTPYRTPVTVDVLDNDTAGAASAPLVASSVVFTSADATDGGTRLVVTGEGSYVVTAQGAITFSPAVGFTGDTSPVTYRVSDANGTTDTATVSITVGSDAVALPDSATTPQDITVTLGALTNDTAGSDGAGLPGTLDPASVRFTSAAATDAGRTLVVSGEGTWTVNAGGTVSFNPLATFTGTTTPVGYAVTDSFANTAAATLTVTVTAITPVAADDSATTPYRTPVDVDVLDNDAAGAPSAPLDPASVVFTSGAATDQGHTLVIAGEGTWTIAADGTVTFTPVAGFSGATTPVSYRVADDNGTTATATVRVSVAAAPIARPDTATTPQNVDVTVQPLTNDTPGADRNGAAGAFQHTTVRFTAGAATNGGRTLVVPGEGTWSIAPVTGAVTFDPIPAFSGVSTPVAYEVTDSHGNPADSTITVTVTPITPTASADTDATAYGTAVTIAVLANDVAGALSAPLDPTTVVFASNGSSVLVTGEGRFVAHPDGTVTFTPAAGFTGLTTPVTYRVADTNGTTATATLTITVGDAPVASPDETSTAQDLEVTLDPLENDAPGAGATLDASSVQLYDPGTATWVDGLSVAGVGEWTVHSDGTVTLDPEPAFTGDASVTYAVTDSDGNSAVATIIVHVAPITPVADDDTAATPANRAVDLDVLANDAAGDASAPLDETSVVFTSPEATDNDHTLVVDGEGTWRIAPETGVVTFTPAAGFSGDTTGVGYLVTDGNGTTATASIRVTVGTGPVARTDSATTAQNVAVSLEPLGNDAAGVHGDGTTGTLDPASIVFTSADATAAGTSLVVEGEGTWSIADDGTITFDPEPGFTGVTTAVGYSVADTWLNTATSSLTVTVTAITPSATDDTATTPANTPVTVAVLDNDDAGAPSAPLDPATVVFTSPAATDGATSLVVPGQGTWTVTAAGTVTFAPVPGFAGLATAVDYRVADTNGTTASAKLTVTVGDGPSALPDSATTAQDTTVIVDALDNDAAGIDGDGTTGTLVAASVVFTSPDATDGARVLVVDGEGTWAVNPDGTISFDPEPAFTGVATAVGYQVTDSFGNSASTTITVEVVAITPTAEDDSATTDYGTAVAIDVLDNDAPGDASAPLDPASVVFTSADATDGGHRLVVVGEGTWTVEGNGTVTFTPVDGFSGETTPATYRVADDNGTTATARLTVTVGRPAGPTAAPDTETTRQNVDVTLDPLTNDTAGAGAGVALDETTVRFTSADATDGGHTLVVEGEGTWTIDAVTGLVTFDPLRTFTGTSTPVGYSVEDNFAQAATSTITVTVTPVIPEAQDDHSSTPFQTPVIIQVLENDTPGATGVSLVVGTILLQDPESGDWATQVVVPGEGTWTVNDNGTVTFAPEDGFTGEVSPAHYRVTDQNGTTVEASITVKVGAPSGTAPSAEPDRVRGTEPGAPVTVPVLDNDTPGTDCAWDPSTVEFTSTDATDGGKTLVVEGEGTWTVNADGSVTFTPEADFHGTATPVDYQVTDECGESVGSTVTVTVPKSPTTCSGHARCPVDPTDPADPADPSNPSAPHHPADDNPVHQPVLPNTGGPRMTLLGLGLLLVLVGVPLVRRRRREA
ncbi:Ig-like domain-containing protein [Nocardioides sp.]|uniref:Ig-like domain-containing protein n=1 Tax=Nocardioides sp. TaxID=35761 RepID=UPI003D0E3A2D